MKTLEHLTAGPNKVEFISKTMGGDLNLSGVLFLPDNFNVKSSYPTVVFTGPFNQVKDLLLQPDMTVASVAYHLGFEYPQYFARLFKKKVGLTPTEYRKQSSSKMIN